MNTVSRWGIIEPILYITVLGLIVLTFVFGGGKCNGEEVYRVTTPQEFIGMLNMTSAYHNTGVRFRCADYKAEYPVIEVHTPYSKSGLKMYKERTAEMMAELSIGWFKLTGSSTVYVFDVGRDLIDVEDDNVVFILEKGSLIEPGILL